MRHSVIKELFQWYKPAKLFASGFCVSNYWGVPLFYSTARGKIGQLSQFFHGSLTLKNDSDARSSSTPEGFARAQSKGNFSDEWKKRGKIYLGIQKKNVHIGKLLSLFCIYDWGDIFTWTNKAHQSRVVLTNFQDLFILKKPINHNDQPINLCAHELFFSFFLFKIFQRWRIWVLKIWNWIYVCYIYVKLSDREIERIFSGLMLKSTIKKFIHLDEISRRNDIAMFINLSVV